MTNISNTVPEQSSRFSAIVMGVLTTAMLAVSAFVMVAVQFSAA